MLVITFICYICYIRDCFFNFKSETLHNDISILLILIYFYCDSLLTCDKQSWQFVYTHVLYKPSIRSSNSVISCRISWGSRLMGGFLGREMKHNMRTVF